MMDLRETILEILEEELGLYNHYSRLERVADKIINHIENMLGIW